MFTVYVLYSIPFNKIYIGYTSDLKQRLLSHNVLATKGYSIRYRPWVLAYNEEYKAKSEALKREKQLKSARGRDFIWQIIHSKYLRE